jgi:hypothetical protein
MAAKFFGMLDEQFAITEKHLSPFDGWSLRPSGQGIRRSRHHAIHFFRCAEWDAADLGPGGWVKQRPAALGRADRPLSSAKHRRTPLIRSAGGHDHAPSSQSTSFQSAGGKPPASRLTESSHRRPDDPQLVAKPGWRV